MADEDYLKRKEWKSYSIGHYPEMPTIMKAWLGLAWCAIICLGGIAGYLTDHPRICFIAAVVTACLLQFKVWPVRCPECKGRVVTRSEESHENGRDYRQFLHDCPKCQITWITKKSIISNDSG